MRGMFQWRGRVRTDLALWGAPLARGSPAAMNAPATTPPTLLLLFSIFARIGLTSFGGGLSGWLMREFVRERRLMSEEDFLNGLAICQAVPGINVTNMAIWIGYRLRGNWGALVCFCGMVVPSAIVIILIAAFFAALSGYEVTHFVLVGAGASAIGLSLSMGLTAAWRVPRKLVPLGIMVLTFVAIGILHWSLVWTVLVAGTVSVTLAFLEA